MGPVNPATSSRFARCGLIAATSLGFAVVQLDVSVVNVAIRPIGADLGGGVTALQWIVSAYTITFAALILTAGSLGDRIGARRVFLTGFALFTLASMACGAAPDLGLLVVARAVQGIGAALLVPCSLSLLSHAHPDPGERSRAVGMWAAGASVALSGGPLVGGVLTATLGWRAIFFINVPIGAAGIALTLRHAGETPVSSSRGLDLAGQLAAIAALGVLAGAVIEGGTHGYTAGLVPAGFALAGLALAGFVIIERRAASPMLPLGLFRVPTFRTTVVIGLLINIAFYGLIFVLSLYFQRVQGLTPLQAGLAFAPMTALVFGANLLAGRVGTARGGRAVVAVGSGLLAIGAVGLLGAGRTTPYPALVGQLVAIGFGLGLIVPVITATLLGSVDAARSGVASGTLNTARQTGSVLGVALFGSLIGGPAGVVGGLHICLAICALLAVVVGGLGLRMRLD